MVTPIPKKQIFFHGVIYAAGFGILAKLLPLAAFLPVAVAISSGYLILSERRKRSRYRAIIENAKAAQVECFPTFEIEDRNSVDSMVMQSFREVTSELEKKCFQLVEKNIQLLSLKEISSTIISSLSAERIVDAVQSFLSKGLGFKEIFMAFYNQENNTFHFYTFQEVAGQSKMEENTIKLDQIEGLLRKSIINRKAIMIKDPAMHPIGNLAGDPIFDATTMQSYLIVPMVKSSYSQSCWNSSDCILKGESVSVNEDARIEDAFCGSCGRLPILGMIGVTDGYKAASLSQVDMVAVETLALQISTLLENSQLYTELQNEEQFRRKVMDSMMNGLITFDNEGRILLANETAERLTGYRVDELKGMNVDTIMLDGVKEGRSGSILRPLDAPQTTFQREVWLVKKGGSKLPISLNTSYLLDENKRVQGTLAIFIDITRIKRMEQKIMHLDKLAALGRFSSSMAHEIRNPLTGIVAGIQYLERVGGIPRDQDENISFILREVNRIDRLISDILNVVRTGDLIYESLAIEEVIEPSVKSIGEMAESKDIRVSVEYPKADRAIEIDKDRIIQVMINLLKNAVEATHQGGEILIKVTFAGDSNDVLFDDGQNLIVVEIRDKGVGLTEEEKNQIFEPFFTTKTEGTGLGLYVSHSIIERHGGYIFVESEKEKGSVFTIYLPVEKVQHGDSSEVRHPVG